MPAKISVTVRTYNEEQNLRECLESVRWADEIIVVDSCSSDRTADIAREFTDKVIVRPWAGHIATSQFVTDQAQNLWVFSIDADERVTPELRDEILALDLDTTIHDAFEVPRLHWFMQRWIRHSAWYPDRKPRLFRTDRCHWGGYAPHDSVQVSGSLGRLHGNLLHFIYRDLAHFAATKNSYSTLTAIDHNRNGRKATLLHVTLRPLHAFMSRYFIRLGFLDGLAGFTICVMEAHCVFMKYLKLYEIQHRLMRFPDRP
ncbi:MAG: glycosyltransferase family 2 protein [Geobacteraceae bacterium]|nr:glycosyltransferase family 2 protein [Geobacteraceae bacterium]NTW80073.1 glycosyltransferase family 2 protein [Geobacteraceae bacterium]